MALYLATAPAAETLWLTDTGQRPNAGRPPSIRTLRTGQRVLLHQYDAQGRLIEIGSMVEIQVISHTKMSIRYEDGREIIIGY